MRDWRRTRESERCSRWCPNIVSATAARPRSRPGVPYARATTATRTLPVDAMGDGIVAWESTSMSDDELHVVVPFGFPAAADPDHCAAGHGLDGAAGRGDAAAFYGRGDARRGDDRARGVGWCRPRGAAGGAALHATGSGACRISAYEGLLDPPGYPCTVSACTERFCTGGVHRSEGVTRAERAQCARGSSAGRRDGVHAEHLCSGRS